uniref:Uncharacterized protein n=1 Tax=Cacopsylla melanoneura TaxID=428564 RepID=A0A8D8XJ28_9HEMI
MLWWTHFAAVGATRYSLRSNVDRLFLLTSTPPNFVLPNTMPLYTGWLTRYNSYWVISTHWHLRYKVTWYSYLPPGVVQRTQGPVLVSNIFSPSMGVGGAYLTWRAALAPILDTICPVRVMCLSSSH